MTTGPECECAAFSEAECACGNYRDIGTVRYETLVGRIAALANEWDRETGPGYRHPHAIQLRDLLRGVK